MVSGGLVAGMHRLPAGYQVERVGRRAQLDLLHVSAAPDASPEIPK